MIRILILMIHPDLNPNKKSRFEFLQKKILVMESSSIKKYIKRCQENYDPAIREMPIRQL